MPSKKKNPLFEEFAKIFESDEEMEISSPFMINRLMSLTDKFVIADVCNRYVGRIPNKLLLLIYRRYIGLDDAPWIRYPKKKKDVEPILLQKICSTFNCNKMHGRQIIELYRQTGVKPEELFGMEEPK